MGRGTVPVDPFQTRLKELREAGVRPAVIARRLGWFTRDGRADGPRVTRTLGLRPNGRGTKGPAIRTTLDYQVALNMADAMGMDPHEVGL